MAKRDAVMLLFIAIVATLNLCAGYVLGAKIGWLPALFGGTGSLSVAWPQRKAAAEADDEELPIEAPPAPEPPKEEPVEATAPTEPSPPPAKPKPTASDVMEGLAAFQAQLADLGNELETADEDAAFDDCCERMQQANHEYLDHANDAIDQLEGDADAAPVRDAVKAGAEEVQRASDEFDSVMANEDKGADIRDQLRDLSSSLIEAAKSAEENVREADESPEAAQLSEEPTPAHAPSPVETEATDPEPPAVAVDPETSLATIDSLLEQLDSLLDDGADKPPLVVATVKVDKPEDGPLADESAASFLEKLGEMVSETIGEDQPAAEYKEGQLIVLLPGDSVDEASRRMEQIRQQVEANTFVDNGVDRKLTVSCGMAQSASGLARAELQELLGEALNEAHRYGGNRACHHDGKFPAPVMPEDIEVEPQTITLA